MTISGTLVVLGTATTNPAPNTLGTVSPGTFAHNIYTPSAAWTSQAKAALFPVNVSNGGGEKSIGLSFVPSGGAAITYTATAWQWNRIAGTWVQPKDNATFNLTGAQNLYIEDPGIDPWFIQLSNISSGTVAIYHDAGLARAL